MKEINLLKELEKIRGIKSYLSKMRSLAKKGVTYRVLDKLHYLVNEKLGIDSKFYSVTESDAGRAIYCSDCGTYLHHVNETRELWCVRIPGMDFALSLNGDCEIYRGVWLEDYDSSEPEYCSDCGINHQ